MNGNDVIEMGIDPGPAIGFVLQHMQARSEEEILKVYSDPESFLDDEDQNVQEFAQKLVEYRTPDEPEESDTDELEESDNEPVEVQEPEVTGYRYDFYRPYSVHKVKADSNDLNWESHASRIAEAARESSGAVNGVTLDVFRVDLFKMVDNHDGWGATPEFKERLL